MNEIQYGTLLRILLDEYAMDRFFERLQEKDETNDMVSLIDLLWYDITPVWYHKSIDNLADDFLVKSKDESKVTWA